MPSHKEYELASLTVSVATFIPKDSTIYISKVQAMLCASKPGKVILDELPAEGLAPIGYRGWKMCLLFPPVCVLEAKLSAIARWRGEVGNVVKVFIAVMFLVSSLEEVWLPQSAALLVSLSSCPAPLLLPVQQPLLGLFLLPPLFTLLGAPLSLLFGSISSHLRLLVTLLPLGLASLVLLSVSSPPNS
jgi:hypothetical protein